MSDNTVGKRGRLESFSQLPSIYLFEQKILRYYIEYLSIDSHNEVQLVSGCISIPDIIYNDKRLANPLNVLIYNHGTATKHAFVPSNPDDPYGRTYALFFSGLHKYITIMPDYLGYGASAHLPHPYCLPKPLGYNSMDALLCSLQLFDKLNLNKASLINTKDIFLSGYSEGGIVTMGLLRILESEYGERFNVAACCPGACPFFTDIKYAVMQPGINTNVYSAYYFISMQRIFKVFDSLTDIFDTKHIDIQILTNELFSGKYHYTEIREKLPKDPKQFLHSKYVNGILNDTLIQNKCYHRFLMKALEAAQFVSDYKFKSKIYYIAAGGDLEVPWDINAKFINENKAKMYPNIEVVNVGNMFDHTNEGKFLVLNMQCYYFNQKRDIINKRRVSKL